MPAVAPPARNLHEPAGIPAAFGPDHSTSLSKGKRRRILIVDDHPLLREGLAARIARQPDLEVCGQVGNLPDAMALAQTLSPDAMTVEITLKGRSGIDLIKQVKALDRGIAVFVYSAQDEAMFAERAVRAGASGYLNKQEPPERVIEAIREVLAGRLYFSAQTTRRVVHMVTGSLDTRLSPVDRLSDRELEVFRSIGHGYTTRRIADDLGLSVRTIETHRENIKAKLDARNSAELSRAAVQWVLESTHVASAAT